MRSYKNKLLRVITIIVIHALLLSDVGFAIPELNKNTLSPPSRFWDEEIVRTAKIKVRDKKTGELVPLYNTEKAFINKVAFRDISHIIAKYFGLSSDGMIEEIRKHIDAAELKLLKTHPHLDPILAGCELDELTYNKDENAYYLPIYRDKVEGRVKAFNYKFYIAEKPEGPDDWPMVPLGDGNELYVRVEDVPEGKSEESQESSQHTTKKNNYRELFIDKNRDWLRELGFTEQELSKVRIDPTRSLSSFGFVWGSTDSYQLPLIMDECRKMIRQKLEKQKGHHEFYIYSVGLGNKPNEAMQFTKAFCAVLQEECGDKKKDWDIYVIGLDVNELPLEHARTPFEQAERELKEKGFNISMKVAYGDGRNRHMLLNIQNNIGAGKRADIILNRNVHFGNVKVGDSRFRLSFDEIPIFFDMYVQIRSLIDVFGKEGGLYITEELSMEIESEGRYLAIPGTKVIAKGNFLGTGIYRIINPHVNLPVNEFMEFNRINIESEKSPNPASSSAEGESHGSYASEDKSEDEDFSKTGFELERDPKKRAKIVEKNRNYLKSKGWLKPIEKLPYETIFVLEDKKFIEFLEAVIRRDNWIRNKDILAEFREAMKEFDISLPRKEEEKVDYNTLIRNNIESFAHLLQSAYFYAQGSDKEGREAFQRYCKTQGKGLAMSFCPHDRFINEHYFGLAEFIYLQDMHDYIRTRFLLNLSLKMFNWQNVFYRTPDHYATFLGSVNVWTGKKRGTEALKSSLPLHNRFAAEILPKWAKTDSELGKGLRMHFEQTKEETLKASALVKEKGTAVVLGAGTFVVLPLVEMLREKLPDGNLKYKKIILIELAENYSEPALKKLIDDGKITEEEAKRVEIVIEDGTMVLDNITHRIDEIMLKATGSNEGKQIPIEELYQFIEEIADLGKLISYALPHAKRRLQKESVNFVVFAMSLNDFTNTIKDYIDMWIEGFPQWMGGRNELDEKWSKYSDIIESGLALIIIDEASRILVPRGILFFGDSIGGEIPDSEKKGKKEKHISLKSQLLRKTIKQAFSGKGENFYLREVNSASWRRPTNELDWKESTGRKIIIGALTYEKAYKTQKPQSEQIHATRFSDTIKLIQAKEKQPLILALGTSWLKGYEKGRYLQYDALNPLITSIRKFCEQREIPFIVGDDSELLAAINAERQKDGNQNAKVVVLAGQDTVTSKEFEPLRNDENTFLAGVNNENLTIDSYIRLMEMLTLTLRLAFNQSVDLENPNIDIKPITNKKGKVLYYIFIPKAEPMDYEDLRDIYKRQLQTFA